MALRVFLLSMFLHFQTNAQLGFDGYGLNCDDSQLKNLILQLVKNKASHFSLKIQHYKDGHISDQYSCSYSVKDSILYQSCGKSKNQHEILKNDLHWFFDPEADDLNPEHAFMVEKDSANVNIQTIYKIRESDTTHGWTTKSYFDKENRIKTQEIIIHGSFVTEKKKEFEYFQNDSIIETSYESVNNQWVSKKKVITKLYPDNKVVTEYKPDNTEPVSRTTFIVEDNQIVKLIIEYNDEKKRTTLYNAKYIIEPQKVKFNRN